MEPDPAPPTTPEASVLSSWEVTPVMLKLVVVVVVAAKLVVQIVVPREMVVVAPKAVLPPPVRPAPAVMPIYALARSELTTLPVPMDVVKDPAVVVMSPVRAGKRAAAR